jgi:hypothetical protein
MTAAIPCGDRVHPGCQTHTRLPAAHMTQARAHKLHSYAHLLLSCTCHLPLITQGPCSCQDRPRLHWDTSVQPRCRHTSHATPRPSTRGLPTRVGRNQRARFHACHTGLAGFMYHCWTSHHQSVTGYRALAGAASQFHHTAGVFPLVARWLPHSPLNSVCTSPRPSFPRVSTPGEGGVLRLSLLPRFASFAQSHRPRHTHTPSADRLIFASLLSVHPEE